MLALVAAPVVFAGPGLLADTMNGPNWTPAPDLIVSKAQCTRWHGVVSTCSIQYSGNDRSQVTPELDYFVYGSWAHEQAALVRSTKNPAVVSTMQGIRDLPARQVTLGVWIAGWLLLVGWAAVASIAKATTASRTESEPRKNVEFPSAAMASPQTAGIAPASLRSGPAPVFGRRGR